MTIQETLSKQVGGLPIWGWGLIGVGGVGVGYYVIHGKLLGGGSNPTSALSSYSAGTSVDANGNLVDSNGNIIQGASNLGQASSSPYQTVPNGQGGSIPILPTGYTPITDSNGNVIGYNQPAPPMSPAPPGTNTGGSTGTTTGVVQTIGGKFTPGNPLIPFGQWPNGVSWRTGQLINVKGQLYTIVVGGGNGLNRIYGVPGQVSASQAQSAPIKTLLYGSQQYYH